MRSESQRVRHFGTTVFSEFSRLAQQHGAVNLGQGFPDFDGPEEIKRAAQDAIAHGVNQYAMGQGALELRNAIAAHAQRFYGQKVNPVTEVMVTSGATEAIFDAVQAFIDPGDEAVVFEPFYDSYVASLQMAGAVIRYVRLRPPDLQHARWWFDSNELAEAFSAKTRLVFLNTPNNPTGKVFTRDELLEVAQHAERSDAVVVSDEVYEHLYFAPAKHVRPATLPELCDRTLTISSGGKSFSFTGWKIGWALGPSRLVQAVQKAHQWVTFATASPFQAAIARALQLPDAYFEGFQADYLKKRDFLIQALRSAGLEPLATEGSYFVIARTDRYFEQGRFTDDFALCRWLTEKGGVAAIPPSAFYSDAHKADAYRLARFAFCKSDAVLQQAADKLARLPSLVVST